MSSVFQHVGGLKPRRNLFDLSYRTNFTCNMGQLIPVMCDEVVPGDHFKIGVEMVVRAQPMVAPVMHEVSCTVHYFFVPDRLIWDLFEDFISQGQLADTDETPLPIRLPRIDPSNYPAPGGVQVYRMFGTLWDYFGLPVGPATDGHSFANIHRPLDFPWRAYNMVFNEFYRDEDLQDKVDLLNHLPLKRNWRKDYFTAARPWRQKGVAPALPVNINFGYIDEVLGPVSSRFIHLRGYDSGQGMSINNPARGFGANSAFFNYGTARSTGSSQTQPFGPVTAQSQMGVYAAPSDPAIPLTAAPGTPGQGRPVILTDDISHIYNETGMAKATTFDVADLRLSFQTQKWLERNARGGTRYTEFLRSHFGVSPSDSRLDRPEYIGGAKMPIIFSEVVQSAPETSAAPNQPQGNMAGHGLAADGQYVGSYNVQEFGIIIGIMSLMPKPAYQNGINRQWLRYLPTDFYFPEFCRLSEQAIKQSEIFSGFGYYDDDAIFGFTGQYDEMRVKQDIVAAEMRVNHPLTLSQWNMARSFTSPPSLNADFIGVDPAPFNRNFAVDTSNAHQFIVNIRNNIRAARPLPLIADPGMVDHY